MTAIRSCRPRAAVLAVGDVPSEAGIYAATVTGGPLGSTHTHVLFTPGVGVLLFGRAGFMPTSVVTRWGPKLASPCLAMLGCSPASAVEATETKVEDPASWWSSLAADLAVAVRVLEGSGAAQAEVAPFTKSARSSRYVALLLRRVERAQAGPGGRE